MKEMERTQIRLPKELKEKARYKAKKEHRSLNNIIIVLLEKYIKNTEQA